MELFRIAAYYRHYDVQNSANTGSVFGARDCGVAITCCVRNCVRHEYESVPKFDDGWRQRGGRVLRIIRLLL
jgi:hypothetical protein